MSEYFDAADIAIAVEEKEMEMTIQQLAVKKWSPEDLFKPSKKWPNGATGEWTSEVNGVMTTNRYENGKLVSSEEAVYTTEPKEV